MSQAYESVDRTERASLLPASLLAILVGAFLVFGAGFASPEALHAAAHDARHAVNTPCH